MVMEQRVAAGEFKAKCLHLLDEVRQTRKAIIITKRGRAVARLAPVEEGLPEIFGRMKGTITVLGDIVGSLPEKWEADE